MRRRGVLALGGELVILAVALALFGCGSASKPAMAHEPLAGLSLAGSGTGGACGVAVDTRGDVYASDPKRGVIEVLGPGGERLGGVRNPAEPCELAVDSKGALYTLEQRGARVVKYLPRSYPFRRKPVYGVPRTIDASGDARGIAVDPYDNRLFVAAGNRVDVYKANGTLGQNDVQRVLLENYTGGTFTLSFGGATTKPLPYDASPGEMRAALARLPTIGRGNVLVREGTNGKTDYFITFTGTLAGKEVGLLKADLSGLKGSRRGRYVVVSELRQLVGGFSGHIGEGVLHDATAVGAYTYHGDKAKVEGLLAESPGLVYRELPGEAGSEFHLADFSLGADGEQSAADVFVNHLPRTYRGYSRYIYVADSTGGRDRVVVFGSRLRNLLHVATVDGSQTPAKSIGFGGGTASMGVDPQTGHFLIRDAAHSAIDEFEATGAYVGQIADSAFSGAGPTGIAVDRAPGRRDGAVYVARGDAGVLTFGPLRARGHKPLPRLSSKLWEACGTAVDSRGDVYVSGEKEIRVLDPTGKELTRISDPRTPCELAVDSKGDVYAVDGPEGKRRVVVFTPGSYPPAAKAAFSRPKEIVALRGWPGWLAVDPRNDHLLVNQGEFDIAEYGSAAEGSMPIRDKIGAEQIKNLETLSGGLDVCAVNGDIYALGRGYLGQWRIYVLDSAGTRMLTRIDGIGSPKGVFTEQGSSLAVDQSNCHIFITMVGRNVEEYEPSGTFVDEFGPQLPFLGGDLAVDNSPSSPNRGDVYVANFEGLWAFGPLGFAG